MYFNCSVDTAVYSNIFQNVEEKDKREYNLVLPLLGDIFVNLML